MRTVNNYFKVYFADDPMLGVFPFDASDSLSTQRAWDAARDLQLVLDDADDPIRDYETKSARQERIKARPPRVTVWARPNLQGPWSKMPLIGTSTGLRGDA